ncbi:aromatic ring-hydroxylating dioxygenase subunit alpha [Tsukamurella sp. 8F]|uniref:aromatic ring-hydroxylating oxygenase subunit alpha n=1 Tax=unclassified Tsukamurella TaxID=2633480 RepID=UPI0023B9F750|nr:MULTISPECIES: aromatic ring-hydroxylating dioxygenase subunit alpha [unclassified Tsukamurella]MDF0531101.1 aromatic ring-hydroxylating dioxygenase subunit alpha [Tsukamurella sp. 8J]MDF0588347.1 aromatic ring-hydroxylating dioxygenase subunit alpha [Tsukamurella sp. 8F]
MVDWSAARFHGRHEYEQEEDAIFRSRWMCTVKASELSERGSFRTVEVGGESILLVRSKDGIAGYVNLCLHRGYPLCENASGRFRGAITCGYHGWAYGFDGKLKGIPLRQDFEDVPQGSLHRVQTDEWLGYVWVNLDPHARSLHAQIDPLLEARFGDLDLPALYRPDQLEVAASREYVVEANWKLIVENFCECYHCPTMHPEICKALPEWRSGYGTVSGHEGRPNTDGSQLSPKATGFSLSGTAVAAPLPTVPDRYLRTFHGLLLWPNVHVMFLPDHVMCQRFFPLSATRTKIVSDWLFHPEAIAAPGFDPSDAVGLVDTTARQDFDACERVQRGVTSRFFSERHTPHEQLIAGFRAWIDAQLGASLDDSVEPGTSSADDLSDAHAAV